MQQPYYLQTGGYDRIAEFGEVGWKGNVVRAANMRFGRIVLAYNIKLKFGNSMGNIGELLNTTSEHSGAGLRWEGLGDYNRNNKREQTEASQKIDL